MYTPVAPTAENPRILFSTAEVARALGVSERFVNQLIQAGSLPSFKIGRLRRVYADDLVAWIDRQRGGPPHRWEEPG
jgi:excisionase family DNA binding protein